MDEGYRSWSSQTSMRIDAHGVTTKTVETTYSGKADGSVKVVTEVTVTQPDGSSSTHTRHKITGGGARHVHPAHKTDSPRPDGGDPGDIKTFRREALEAHNERRKRHGVPPLSLSDDLNEYAMKWAQHLADRDIFQHSNCDLNGERLGENIAYTWSSAGEHYSGEEPTEQWYSEISKHNYNKEFQHGTGHFTQIVWKGTQEMGIAKVHDNSGKIYVVGSYRPAGNMIGSFQENVFRPH